MAILFAVVALTGIPGLIDPNIMLALVALFVWMGADAEARAVRARGGLAGVLVSAVMVRRFAAVAPDDTLGAIVEYARQASQRDFPVTVDGQLVGLVTREDLRASLHELGPDGRVFQVMRRELPTIGPAERGLALLAAGAPAVPVVARGQLAGLLMPEHLSQFVRLRDHPSDDVSRGDGVRLRV